MQTFLNYQKEALYFGYLPKSLDDIAKKLVGPTYIYDLSMINARFKDMRKALPQSSQIFYAMKANSAIDVLKKLKSSGSGVDVVSGGEITRALEAGFYPQDIVYSGVGKTSAEIEYALTLDILQINVESLPEMKRIAEINERLNQTRKGKKAKIALRLNPDVDIKTHPYIATGLSENKFGLEISALPKILEIIDQYKDSLQLVGTSLHLGSQMTDLSGFSEGLRKLKAIYLDLRQRYASVSIFDAGGGLGVYYDRQDLSAEHELLLEYAIRVQKEVGDLDASLQFEPGRWLVAHAGVLLTQVQYVKETSQKIFVIVDSGMNHFIRPALYSAFHQVYSVRKATDAVCKKYDIVGPICESADFLAKNINLSEVQEGDWLAVASVGAYGYSMANTYNLHKLPAEISF
jgi:diaminopimelate decarboxylase